MKKLGLYLLCMAMLASWGYAQQVTTYLSTHETTTYQPHDWETPTWNLAVTPVGYNTRHTETGQAALLLHFDNAVDGWGLVETYFADEDATGLSTGFTARAYVEAVEGATGVPALKLETAGAGQGSEIPLALNAWTTVELPAANLTGTYTGFKLVIGGNGSTGAFNIWVETLNKDGVLWDDFEAPATVNMAMDNVPATANLDGGLVGGTLGDATYGDIPAASQGTGLAGFNWDGEADGTIELKWQFPDYAFSLEGESVLAFDIYLPAGTTLPTTTSLFLVDSWQHIYFDAPAVNDAWVTLTADISSLSQSGQYEIIFSMQGLGASGTLFLDNVRMTHSLVPELVDLADLTIYEGDSYSKTPALKASSPAATSWTLVRPASLATNMTFSTSTGQFTYAPQAGDPDVTVEIYASNAYGDSNHVSWTVTVSAPTSLVPVVEAVADASVVEGNTYALQPTLAAGSPEATSWTLVSPALGERMSFDTATGLFTYATQAGDADLTIEIYASNGQGDSDPVSWDLTIEDAPAPLLNETINYLDTCETFTPAGHDWTDPSWANGAVTTAGFTNVNVEEGSASLHLVFDTSLNGFGLVETASFTAQAVDTLTEGFAARVLVKARSGATGAPAFKLETGGAGAGAEVGLTLDQWQTVTLPASSLSGTYTSFKLVVSDNGVTAAGVFDLWVDNLTLEGTLWDGFESPADPNIYLADIDVSANLNANLIGGTLGDATYGDIPAAAQGTGVMGLVWSGESNGIIEVKWGMPYKYDLADYDRLVMEVYSADTTSMSVFGLVIANSWEYVSIAPPTAAGAWQTMVFDLSQIDTADRTEFILKMEGTSENGRMFFDNVRLVSGESPAVNAVKPSSWSLFE